MIINAKTKGIKKESFRYVFEGSIETEEELVIELDMGLYVTDSIKAGGWIEAGGSIKAGGLSGIQAGLYITCKGILKFGLKAFAGICTWRTITDEEKTITCGKLEGGVVEYGIVKEIGIEKEEVSLSGKEVSVTIDNKTYKAKIL